MTINEISIELKNIDLGRYIIYVDLNNGDVHIGKSGTRTKKSELLIGKVDYLDNSKKKLIKKFFSDVNRVIHDYHSSGSLICRSTANKEFSKKYVEIFKPVLVVANPYYKSSEPMCLYDVNVMKYNLNKYTGLISSEEEKVKRKNAAMKAVQTKENICLNYVKNIEIEIPDFDREELETIAFEHWYDWKCLTDDDFEFNFRANYTDDDMKRWCVNYLRHECTTYDDDLAEMYGNVGVQIGHDILQDRINNAIYGKYEWLR